MRMRARQVPQPACQSMSATVVVDVVVVGMVVMATLTVIVSAALRLRHACQHARADPLQHVDNDQFAEACSAWRRCSWASVFAAAS